MIGKPYNRMTQKERDKQEHDAAQWPSSLLRDTTYCGGKVGPGPPEHTEEDRYIGAGGGAMKIDEQEA